MRTKRYKSVAGYLRSADERLSYEQSMREAKRSGDIENVRKADAEGVRKILNNLLPQVGITDHIRDDERPADGIKRLQQTATNQRATDALRDCERWLKRRIVPISSSTIATSVESSKNRYGYQSGAVGFGSSTITATQRPAVTHKIYGFNRDNHEDRVIIYFDRDDDGTDALFKRAQKIAGPTFCMHAGSSVSETEAALVPADCKGVLLRQALLYARVPELDPNYRLRRRRA